MIGLNGAECQRQGRTATGENLSHVHCKIPATRGAKVLSLGLKENKHDVFSFSENLLLCSPFFSIYISAARSSIRPGSWPPISERIPGANFPRAVEDSLVNFSCWCFWGAGSGQMVEEESLNKFLGTSFPRPKPT